jgi:hypothetical protein
MPLKNPLLPLPIPPQISIAPQAALNALIADERTVDGPEGFAHGTVA